MNFKTKVSRSLIHNFISRFISGSSFNIQSLNTSTSEKSPYPLDKNILTIKRLYSLIILLSDGIMVTNPFNESGYALQVPVAIGFTATINRLSIQTLASAPQLNKQQNSVTKPISCRLSSFG